jgi:alpha-galactosidase/6-phospho-beta-glucosidase family protein
VRYLLEKCQNNHTEFKQTIVLCCKQHTTFTGAVAMLKEACGRLFADAHVKSNRHKRSITKVNTKNNNHNRGNKKMVNGVDTSDLSCWYMNEEMKNLPNWLQKKIATNNDHQSKNKDKIHEKKKARVNVSAMNTDGGSNNNNGSNSSPSNDSNSIIAGVINGMHNAQRQVGHQFPVNGRSASVAAVSRNRSGGAVDDSSVVTFNHLGNPV